MDWGKEIARGNTATLYLKEGRVIKLFDERLSQWEAEYEAGKQKYARSCGLPVPEIYEATKIQGRQVIIMEYVEGETFGDIVRKDMSLFGKYLELSVDIQQEIHAKEAAGLEPMKERLGHMLERAPHLGEDTRTILLKKLEGMPQGTKLCHGDFHVFNVIETEGGNVIIDWVDATAGEPVADVCRTYLLYLGFPGDLAARYLKTYCERSGIKQEDVLNWLGILAGARLNENLSPEMAADYLKLIQEELEK